MQKITDFKPGDRVRVNLKDFRGTTDARNLTDGDLVTVVSVHPLSGFNDTAGTLMIEGLTSATTYQPPGSFGHLVFDAPVPEDQLTEQQDEITATLLDGTVVRVGDTVRVSPDRFKWDPQHMSRGEVVTITSITERTGPDNWLINGAGYEWFDGVPSNGEALGDALVADAERNEANALRAEIGTLKQAASDERRRLCAEIDALKADLSEMDRNRDAALADGDTLRANLAQTVREANQFQATLSYAAKMLTDAQLQRVDGYQQGFADGAQD